jgi:UDP-N-acetyl-D-mannosaminuronate dehydrogenase
LWYESTVYPGAVGDDCVPILEHASGLKAGADFDVGYSPERINPGDKKHRVETITKVFSAQNPDARYRRRYLWIGGHRRHSPRVENTHRGVAFDDIDALEPADAVILAVAHDAYVEGGWRLVQRLLLDGAGLVLSK